MRILFGTDGIRGKAHQYPLDAATMFKLGVVLARRYPGTILIGRDTRESGPEIAGALAAGIAEQGGKPIVVGVIPTPGVAYLCRATDAVAAISVSASHNPYEDNGVKVFGHDGMKIPDAREEELEEELRSLEECGTGSQPVRGREAAASGGGRGENPSHIEQDENFLGQGVSLAGERVVLDTGHGAAYRIAPEVFRRAGADVLVINDQPTGTNINANAGAMHPENLARTVVAEGADFGVAFDGDADRAVFVDDAGKVRDGDEIIYLWAKRLKSEGRLAANCVVTTVMSNFGFEQQLVADGIELVRASVGDKYVLEAMLARGAVIGGEQSGHIIDLLNHTTGDGIHTALVFGELLAQAHQPFSKLRTFDPVPQVLLNENVSSKPPLESLPRFQAALAKAEAQLAGRGRILVRYSGTENKVRVMVEGPEDARVIAEQLRDVLKEEIESLS
jgi:phosphoglucosamine mutase